MVMQTVRSRAHSNSHVLPYFVNDLKKLESPSIDSNISPLCNSSRTRKLLDRSFACELSGSDLTQRSRNRSPNTVLPLHDVIQQQQQQQQLQQQQHSSSSSLHVLLSPQRQPLLQHVCNKLNILNRDNHKKNNNNNNNSTKSFQFSTSSWPSALIMALGLIAITFSIGSVLSNKVMEQKVTELEHMRDRLMDTQSALNAQLTRAKRRRRQIEEEEQQQQQQHHALKISPTTSESTAAAAMKSIASLPTDKLQEMIVTLLHDVQQLQQAVLDEKEIAFIAKQEIDLQVERTKHIEEERNGQLTEMMLSIQNMARMQATSDFGPGPHYATFNLGIPGMRGTQQFTIEFASLQHMPVAVNQFLQQVKRNLWKDASFYLKAQHVTMARPGLQAKAEFSSSLLQHIPFPEYSDAMPHDEYTLGLNNDQPSGRPDFYINMMDNRIPHGPRGHQRDGSAEPCFAKIILGKEAVDAIRQLPNSDNDPFLLQQAVQIKGIDFVSDIRKVAGGAAYLAANK